MDFSSCPYCGEVINIPSGNCPDCRESLAPQAPGRVLSDQRHNAAGATESATGFYQAYLSGAELRGVMISGSDFFGADLSAADLRGAELSHVNFCKADLSGADLRRANLYGADLSDANLCGADLTGATLIDVSLEQAKFDGFTIWPDDIDPLDYGAIQLK